MRKLLGAYLGSSLAVIFHLSQIFFEKTCKNLSTLIINFLQTFPVNEMVIDL
jgi:hypothetical protein